MVLRRYVNHISADIRSLERRFGSEVREEQETYEFNRRDTRKNPPR